MRRMVILGMDGHDAGAAVIVDGNVVAAVNEERLEIRPASFQMPGLQTFDRADYAGVPVSDVRRRARAGG